MLPQQFWVKKNYFVFLDELRNNIKSELFDLTDILKQPEIQSVINAKEFYFEKGRDALMMWYNYQASDDLKNKLLQFANDYKGLQKESESDQKLNGALKLIFKVISYCDYHVKDKNKFNEYEDKRAVADAYVRMSVWTEKAIQYKLAYKEVGSGAPLNTFNFLLDPRKQSSIVSEDHRAQISNKLLNKKYEAYSFVEDLISFFEPYNLETVRPENYTHLLTCIVYSIQNEWQEDIGSEKPLAHFTRIIEDVKRNLRNDYELSEKLKFGPQAKNFVWIQDKNDVLGDVMAHYEIMMRKDEVYLEVHFEGKQNERDIFSASIKVLPKKLTWFDWNKSKSIRYQQGFDINDPDLSEHLIHGVTYLEEYIGDVLRNIKRSIKIKPKGTMNIQPLNQILYGPPGTGKTYNTINKAIAIASSDFDLKVPREKIKAEFERLMREGQVVFTTFSSEHEL